MSEKTLNNIKREAGRLLAAGFPFHSHLLLDAIQKGQNIASAVERVATLLERKLYNAEAVRLRNTARLSLAK